MTSEEGSGGGDSNKWSVEIQKAKGGSIKSEIEGKQALRTRSCVLRIFIKNIELLFAAKTIKTKN